MTDARKRRWRELAEAACAEQDPQKLIEIVEELNRALERQGEKRTHEGDDPGENSGSDCSHPASNLRSEPYPAAATGLVA